MHFKQIIAFIAAVTISLAAAAYRFDDSGHSIGLISLKGGKTRHPFVLECGRKHYCLIATATVLPPYRGDVQISLQGRLQIDFDIFLSKPVIDLGVHKFPELRNHALYGLEAGDRIALWVRLYPPQLDPVCQMVVEDGFIAYQYGTQEYFFCSEACRNAFKRRPDQYADRASVRGKYSLRFNDTRSGAAVLNMPIIFKGKDQKDGKGGHAH